MLCVFLTTCFCTCLIWLVSAFALCPALSQSICPTIIARLQTITTRKYLGNILQLSTLNTPRLQYIARHHADQVTLIIPLVLPVDTADKSNRVRTLTGKEIELDIEPDYKVRILPISHSVEMIAESGNSNTSGAGVAHKGARGGEGGHPTGSAAPHLRRKADVRLHPIPGPT